MVLMPTSCWNTDSATPTSTTRAPKENSGAGFSSVPVAARSSSMLRTSSASAERASILRAFSMRPVLTSQLGDSGTEKLSQKNASAGIASDNIIQRQPVSSTQMSSPCSAMPQFTKYAMVMPPVMAICWYAPS